MAGGRCPAGMEKVKPPTRDRAYEISAVESWDASTAATTWSPSELVEIWIDVKAKYIQRYKRSGGPVCYCGQGYRSQEDIPCTSEKKFGFIATVDIGDGNGRTTKVGPWTNCTEPFMESAKYIGLLLYAVDANEVKVGSWEIPVESPPQFWTPPDLGCDGKAVMHADAQPKSYRHHFSFRAPSAGAGTLTFRALIKQGDTNGGAFYWPYAPASAGSGDPYDYIAGGDLQLAEITSVPKTQTWFSANADGMNCDDVCSTIATLAQGQAMECDAAALASVATAGPSELKKEIGSFFTHQQPVLGGCAASNPTISETGDTWLWFHKTSASDNTCSAGEITAPSCAAIPATSDFKSRRLCPCKLVRRRLAHMEQLPCPRALPPRNNDAAPDLSGGCPHYVPPPRHPRLESVVGAAQVTPVHATNGASSHGATKLAAPLLLGALCALGGGRGAYTPFVFFAVASQLLRPSAAHNWIVNPTSRARAASTTKPCRSRRSNIPDIHVNAGQEFEMSWATGHGDIPNQGAHYFTLVRAEDAKYLVLVNKNTLTEYLTAGWLMDLMAQGGSGKAPTAAPTVGPAPDFTFWKGSKWEKKHLSWNSTMAGSKGGHADNSAHEVEGKVLMHPLDEDYIERPASFKCKFGRSSLSPVSGDGCFGIGGRLQQWRYPVDSTNFDYRSEHSSSKYPWILQAHRFAQSGHFPAQADIAKFVINAPPGEYIMHWFWAGYTDCTDIAVMPPSVVVPHLSAAMYGIMGSEYQFSRIDHCQFAGGRTQGLDFWDIRLRSYTRDIRNGGGCPTDDPINALDDKAGSSVANSQRTCFVIPPETTGAVNALGESAAEALAACKKRCRGLTKWLCDGINVVPLEAPELLLFTNTSVNDRGIPWGKGDCNADCFEHELAAQRADSFVCYPLKKAGVRIVEEDWTLATTDVYDEVWYSTCYVFEPLREFTGLPTTCMDYISSEFPAGMCKLEILPRWRHDDHCISCENALAAVNSSTTTVLPRWTPLAADDCRMCDHIEQPDVPPPTPAPTVPASSYGDGSQWPQNFTSPDGNVFVGWKHGYIEGTASAAEEAAAKNSITFGIGCATCGSTGWVAIGINPSSPNASLMAGTSAVIWKLGEGTVREYEIGGQSKFGIVPWGARNHIDKVATDPTSGRASFALGIGGGAITVWGIGSATLDHTSAAQRLTWAYGTSGWSQHGTTARGSAVVDVRQPTAVAAEPQAPAADPPLNDGANDDAATTGLIVGLSLGGAAIVALLVAVVLTIVIVVAQKRSRGAARLASNSPAPSKPASGSGWPAHQDTHSHVVVGQSVQLTARSHDDEILPSYDEARENPVYSL